jgi:hypothetical protein
LIHAQTTKPDSGVFPRLRSKAAPEPERELAVIDTEEERVHFVDGEPVARTVI